MRYIREYKKGLSLSLITSGKLNSYLADIDRQAQAMYLQLVEQMTQNGESETFKAKNQLEWACQMNNISNRAREVMNTKLIFV